MLGKKKIPDFFGDLLLLSFRYDAHHIGVATRPNWTLNVILTSSESYLSLRCDWKQQQQEELDDGAENPHRRIQFIDSLQFLHSSLAKLVTMCPSMPLTDALPWSDVVKKDKGVFPYSFLNSEDKLEETSLPEISEFYDSLTRTHLTPSDYQRTITACNEMNCQTFGDYMMSKSRKKAYIIVTHIIDLVSVCV